MTTSFLVPYRTERWRERLWESVLARLAHHLWEEDVEIIVNDDDARVPGMFNHPAAINKCAAEATGDVFVIYDADTTFDVAGPELMLDAIAKTRQDREWRLPERYVQLDEEPTRARVDGLVLGGIGARIDPDERLWVGRNVSWSGIVIVPREAFELVCGYDERYEGWGADDVAFATAMNTMYRTARRYPGECVHLWHERGPQEQGLHPAGDAGRDLTRRYEQASGDRDAMAVLLAEKRAFNKERT